MAFNLAGSEVYKQAQVCKRICDNLIVKLGLMTSQNEVVPLKQVQNNLEDDFSLIYDPALHVRFDDKMKLAELLKNAERDKLTSIVKMLKSSEKSNLNILDSMGGDKLQIKID